MDSIFALLGFFGGTIGPVIVGTATALMIVVWDWRLALLGLFCVQIGVVSAAVALGQLPSEWAGVMVVVMGLATLILALSAQRMTRTTTLYQSGTWQLRALLLVLVYIGWELAEVNLPLPVVNPQLADLFVWLAMCMLVILGLSDNPLFSTVALLMWLIPVQVIAAIIVNSPSLVALIGMLTLLLALAGSYLMLVEQVTVEQDAPVVTDITFPGDLRIPSASNFQPEEEEGWIAWLQRQSWGAAALERARELMARWRP
jgi:hypothetical protein